MTKTDTHQLQREIEIYKQALERAESIASRFGYHSPYMDEIAVIAQQALIEGGKRHEPTRSR